MKLYLVNNKFQKSPQISVEDDFFRGYGVFETLIALKKEPQDLKEHIDRLFHSAKQIDLKLKYNKEQILQMTLKTVQKSPHQTQRLKIIAITNKVIIISQPLKVDTKPQKQGVALKSIVCHRSLPEVKSISYLESYISHEKAVKAKAYEALLIDENKEVYEGAYSNFFWFEGTTLCTRKNEVLPGITRDKILKKSPFKVKFKTIKLPELLKKQEVFITSSVIGIIPVTKIDGKKIGSGKPGNKTQELIKLFSSASNK